MNDFNLNVRGLDLDKAEGVWIQYEGGIAFKIASSKTKRFQKQSNKMMHPHRKQLKKDSLSVEIMTQITVELMANYILVDWRGMTNNGEEFPYSVENAKRFLADPKYVDIREWIWSVSESTTNFRETEQKK